MLAHHSAVEIRAERAIMSQRFVYWAVRDTDATALDLGCSRVRGGRVVRFSCALEAETPTGPLCIRIGARVVRPARRPVVFEDLSGVARWRRHVSSLRFGPHGSTWIPGRCA